MDPQTKHTIMAHDDDELRALIRKWLDARGVSQTYQRALTPATAIISITYADANGEVVREQFIHTTARALRDIVKLF